MAPPENQLLTLDDWLSAYRAGASVADLIGDRARRLDDSADLGAMLGNVAVNELKGRSVAVVDDHTPTARTWPTSSRTASMPPRLATWSSS